MACEDDNKQHRCDDGNKQFEKHSVPTLLPSQLAATTDVFVQFLKKYYEWMNQSGNPSEVIENSVEYRNLYCTTDSYLDLLFEEYGFGWLDNKATHRANIIAHLDDIYKTKGTINSIKILFRCMAGEEVDVILPREYVLRPSDGEWQQDFVVTAKLTQGTTPFSLAGNFVDVKTYFPDQPEQRFDVEIFEVTHIVDNVYQFKISRYHEGFFFWDSIIEYNGNVFNVVPTVGDMYQIESAGAGFRLGDTYEVCDYVRNESYNTFLTAVNSPQDLYHVGSYAVEDRYVSSTAQIILDAIGYLYAPIKFTRPYLIDRKTNRFIDEYVERYHYTDGTMYEEIRRENDVLLYKSHRGNQVATQTRYLDGTVTFELEQNGELDSPEIVMNWDALIVAMFDSIMGVQNRYELIFRSINPATGFMYGDFNQDGIIDPIDLIHLIRRSMGLSLTHGTLSNDQQFIRDNIDEIGRLIIARDVVTPLTYYTDSCTSVKVTDTVGATGALVDIDSVRFGYDFPKVGFTYILPNESREIYNLYTDSGYWLPGTFYSDDFESIQRGIVAYSASAVARGTHYWKSSKGFLDDIIMLHDGFYYQDFSYVVRSEQSPSQALSWINETVHPAAFQVFAEQLIRSNLIIEQDPPHLQVTQDIFRRMAIVVRPVFKPEYIEAGYSVLDALSQYQSEREEMFSPTGYEWAEGADDLVAILDWGELKVNDPPYNTTGYTVDDDYLIEDFYLMRFSR